MTNEEMYKKFVEKNNYMKNAMTMAGNKHLIGHIEKVDLAKNKVISTMQEKKIEGYITQLVMAVMNGQFVVSNPSALQGFNFSLLNAKPVIKKEDKQETPKKEVTYTVEYDDEAYEVSIISHRGLRTDIVANYILYEVLEEIVNAGVRTNEEKDVIQGIFNKDIPTLRKDGVPDSIIKEAYLAVIKWLSKVDIDRLHCTYMDWGDYDYNIMRGLRKKFDLGERLFIDHPESKEFVVKDTTYKVLDEADAREAFEESVDDLFETNGPTVFGDPARYITVDLDFAQEWLFNSDADFIREEEDNEELKRLYCQYGGGDLDYNWDELSDDEWEEVRDKTIDNYVNEKGEDAATFMEYMNDNFDKDWVSNDFWKGHVYPDYDTLISDFGYEHELSPCEEVEQFDAYGKKFYAFKMD